MKIISKSLIAAVVVSALFALVGTSCRTMQGFGSDVERTGDHIKEAARR